MMQVRACTALIAFALAVTIAACGRQSQTTQQAAEKAKESASKAAEATKEAAKATMEAAKDATKAAAEATKDATAKAADATKEGAAKAADATKEAADKRVETEPTRPCAGKRNTARHATPRPERPRAPRASPLHVGRNYWYVSAMMVVAFLVSLRIPRHPEYLRVDH